MTFEYHKAVTLPEAVALNAAYSNFPVLAGGTDLIVQWRAGIRNLQGVVDISGVEEMKSIDFNEDVIEIGACSTHAEISRNTEVIKYLPLLAKACRSIGAVQIQNRGTIGGNIMNASPAGDIPPALVVYDTDLLLSSVKGERWVAARDFFVGYRKTALNPDELLTKIRIRKVRRRDERAEFYKIGTRRAQAISKVVMCIRAEIFHGGISDIAIALGSMAPTVVRAYGTEALLKGKMITEALIDQAGRSLSDEFHPIDDVRSTSKYRSFVCGGLICRYLKQVNLKK